MAGKKIHTYGDRCLVPPLSARFWNCIVVHQSLSCTAGERGTGLSRQVVEAAGGSMLQESRDVLVRDVDIDGTSIAISCSIGIEYFNVDLGTELHIPFPCGTPSVVCGIK